MKMSDLGQTGPTESSVYWEVYKVQSTAPN